MLQSAQFMLDDDNPDNLICMWGCCKCLFSCVLFVTTGVYLAFWCFLIILPWIVHTVSVFLLLDNKCASLNITECYISKTLVTSTCLDFCQHECSVVIWIGIGLFILVLVLSGIIQSIRKSIKSPEEIAELKTVAIQRNGLNHED